MDITYKKDFFPRQGRSAGEMIKELTDSDAFYSYLLKQVDKELSITIELKEKKSEKDRMYAYYHKVVLGVARIMFTDDGWENVDKYKADELLKCACAKDFVTNGITGEKLVYLEPKSGMNKERMVKYITDCIHFLESNGYEVPESQTFIIESQTGIKGFTKVKK
jgi:hypothetical protein